MKKLILLPLAMLGSGLVLAQQEYGRVLSSMPIMQQVSVPRQVCNTEQVEVQGQKSGAGALMGAVAGGAIGNAVGSGNGKTAATVLGLFGGAMLGDKIEGAPTSQVQNVQRCSTQNVYENRTVGYRVVYEYAGRQYEVQMPRDPGARIRLQVIPVGADVPMGPSSDAGSYTQPAVVAQTREVVVMPAAYPGYYRQPYFAPVGIQLDLGYVVGNGGHRRWH